jgi:hypothetical protein
MWILFVCIAIVMVVAVALCSLYIIDDGDDNNGG